MLEGADAWALALFAAFCIGVAKAGFSGTSLLAVAIFTHLFDARLQAGFALPLLIIADLIVYPAFRKYGSWHDVWRLLPAALVGVGAGWWLLGNVPEIVARRIIGCLILMLLALQSLRVLKPKLLEAIADHRAFGTGAGVAAGVTTMLANAAGPVFQLYLLSRRVPKMELIGIGARFFLLINLIKVPLNQNLGSITWETLWTNIRLAPAIVLGIWIGKSALQKVPQRAFEWMILFFAAVAAIKMLV
ncbi:sulfite exporter TauE/SafE family protein [Haloferula sp. A504]|uniref:sulfite exporter TauE/SafE family protein n=1 Tax=Haloferula sp. A504 TaxID=3373601 RepID=UPI0031C84EE9|nr:sulfite exporter TauE/SafE family protein [Verrucomicrobiaceae bacterium E54]